MSDTAPAPTWYKSWFDTPYYHILYRDRDHTEAALFMRRLTSALDLSTDSHILDLACGRGRHSMFLNQLGFKVTGVDLSENSIAFAKAQLPQSPSSSKAAENLKPLDPSRIDFRVHDMTQPLEQRFDAVFNLFTSFGYFPKEDQNLQTIKAIKANLKPNGRAVIDFMNVPYVLRKLVLQDEKTEEGITFQLSRKYEAGFICKGIRFTDQGHDYHFTEKVRAFVLADFQNFFDQAGLELVDLYGNYALDDYDTTQSERLIMVVR